MPKSNNYGENWPIILVGYKKSLYSASFITLHEMSFENILFNKKMKNISKSVASFQDLFSIIKILLTLQSSVYLHFIRNKLQNCQKEKVKG